MFTESAAGVADLDGSAAFLGEDADGPAGVEGDPVRAEQDG